MDRDARRWHILFGTFVLVWTSLALHTRPVHGDEPKSVLDSKSRYFLLTGQEPPEPFVPLKPRTIEDTRRLEAIKQFCIGARLENEYRWNDAIAAYRKALENDSKSLAIYKAIINACNAARRTKDAANYLREAVDLVPDDYELLGRLGEALEEQGQLDSAAELYKRALASPKLPSRHPMAVLIKVNLGEIYEQQRNFDEASNYYQDVIEAMEHSREYGLQNLPTQPQFLRNRTETYERFGDAFRMAKRFDDALRAYQLAQTVSPRSSRFAQKVAEIFIDQEKFDQALEYLDKYLADQTPQGSQAYERLAFVLGKLSRSEEVLARVQAAAEKDRFNVGLQYFLGTLYEEAGEIDKAKTIYSSVLKDPQDPRVYASLARIYQKEDRFHDLILLLGDALEKQLEGRAGATEAMDEQTKVLSTNPETAQRVVQAARQIHTENPKQLKLGARYFVAQVALRAKLHEAAAEFFRLCIAERPKAAPLYRDLAQALELGGLTDDAIQAAGEAIAIEPEEVQGHSTQAWVYTHAGQYQKAAEKYEQILKDFSENGNVARVARYLLSNIYVQLDDMPKAEKALEEILQKYPDDESANNDLGYIWADQGKNLEQAEKMVRKAIEVYAAKREVGQPEQNAAYLDSLGWVLYKLGRPAEARKYLEDAAKMDEGGTDGTIVDHLGDVLLRLKELAKAREMWLKAKEILEKAEGPRREEKRLKEINDKLKSLEEQKNGKGEIKRERSEPR